jgi:hypothetical protein
VAFAIFTSTIILVSISDQGGLPVTISKTVQPKLQISANLLWPVYVITSGAIQYGVPVSVLCSAHNTLLDPKSVSLHCPSSSIIMFAALMSL